MESAFYTIQIYAFTFIKMSEMRRHSVDIPISKALVALRRVRSLRDPSTNSMSKYSALFDNLNWETNSCGDISLGLVHGCHEVGSKDNSKCPYRTQNLGFYGQSEESYHDLRICNTKSILCKDQNWVDNKVPIPIRMKQIEQSVHCHKEAYGDKIFGERYCSDHRDTGSLDLTCVDSNNEPISRLPDTARIDHTESKRKIRYQSRRKSYAEASDFVSRVGSPCTSVTDPLLEGSSSYANEEIDVEVSCCWSKTPKFREPNLFFDVESQWKNINYESPRSLSHKFRPQTFNELVGQNIVAKSLLSAISKGKITSFYLFHGPRGTGKTSASRIFAAALNCLSNDENRPCGVCRECIVFFSGKSKDVREVDSLRINRADRIRSLIKNAFAPPISSRFKVFIIDECHMLKGETWATVLNGLDGFSQHVIFIIISDDLDKLPHCVVSRSQKYHFPKIKDADVSRRLGKICIQEGFEFEKVALDFVAAKSNGSLRVAEMMLDQLSLLGKRITLSLVYELIGTVSDDELLDLLDLALSSDTSNTVRRARELMKSRIDPMQLISQLANLIMDILAGKNYQGASEVRIKFLERHNSEAHSQKLSHALKILSESEKQLRTSKNQTTWLTVALLQLSSAEPCFLDSNDSKMCQRTSNQRDGDFCSASSTGESLKHWVACACDDDKLHRWELQEDYKEKLETIWYKVTDTCQSRSLRNFLKREGKLSSLCFNQGLAIAELEFHHPAHAAKAEKRWKVIANSLQSVLNCNIEIRITFTPFSSVEKNARANKTSFSLFSCSGGFQKKSKSSSAHGVDPSDGSEKTSEKPMIREKNLETLSSYCGSQSSHSTIRNSEGNALRTGAGINNPNKEGCNHVCHVLSIQEPEKQPNCLAKAVRFHKILRSSGSPWMICLRIQPQNELALSSPKKASFETYFCGSGPYIFSRDKDGLRDDAKVNCWRAPMFPFKKAWQLRHRRQRSQLVDWVMPCATSK